jgi:hypothetical protein
MFFETQVERRCGLHAVHNLMRSSAVTLDEMNEAAAACAEESEDTRENHVSAAGDWSMDTLRRVLTARGFQVRRAVRVSAAGVRWDVAPMQDLLEDPRALGFIIVHRDHYACLRKHEGAWELCDSLDDAPLPVEAEHFCRQLLYQRCTAFLVREA